MGGKGGVGIRGTVVFNYGSVNTVGGSGGKGGLKGDSGSNGRAGSVGKGIAGTLTYPDAASAQDSNDNSTWSDATTISSSEALAGSKTIDLGDATVKYLRLKVIKQ